jgi:hypothetical protein
MQFKRLVAHPRSELGTDMLLVYDLNYTVVEDVGFSVDRV